MDPQCQHLLPHHHTFHNLPHHSRNKHHRLLNNLIADPHTCRHGLGPLTDLKLSAFLHFLQAKVQLLSQRVQKKRTPRPKLFHMLKVATQAAHLLVIFLDPSFSQTKSLEIPDSRRPHQVIQPRKPFLNFHTPTK